MEVGDIAGMQVFRYALHPDSVHGDQQGWTSALERGRRDSLNHDWGRIRPVSGLRLNSTIMEQMLVSSPILPAYHLWEEEHHTITWNDQGPVLTDVWQDSSMAGLSQHSCELGSTTPPMVSKPCGWSIKHLAGRWPNSQHQDFPRIEGFKYLALASFHALQETALQSVIPFFSNK